MAKALIERVYAKPEPQQFHTAGDVYGAFNPGTGQFNPLGEFPKDVKLSPGETLYSKSGGELKPIGSGGPKEMPAEAAGRLAMMEAARPRLEEARRYFLTPGFGTAATWLMQARTPIWEAAGFLGMTPETLEKVYGHHHPDFLKNAARAFS